MKTIKLEFDCGKAGKVTWEAPRDAFSSDACPSALQGCGTGALQFLLL